MAASVEVAVFAETNLGTHIAVSVPSYITAGELKNKLGREHYLIYPSLGEVKVNALMVKRRSCFYHLPDSLVVKNVFQKSKHCWFLKMAATRVEDVCRQAVDLTDKFHSQPAKIIDRIHHQEATTTVANATARKEEREISGSMNGTTNATVRQEEREISGSMDDTTNATASQEEREISGSMNGATNATARKEEQQISQSMNDTTVDPGRKEKREISRSVNGSTNVTGRKEEPEISQSMNGATNATSKEEEREIPQSMNGTVSECSSDIISVTGILTRYFPVSDEKNVCNNEVESTRKTNEEYELEEIPVRELGETQSNNHVASEGLLVEQSDNQKSRSQNNMDCLFIDSGAGKSKFNVVNKINGKHPKAGLLPVATELTNLGEGGASLFGCDRSDDNQGRRQLELEQSQCNIATKIGKCRSALAGLASTRNGDRDTENKIINGESGAYHCVQDTNIQEFQSNTEAKQKEIAVPAHAMTTSVGFGMKRRITATTHSAQQDFNLEISKCDIVSRTRKKRVKSQSSVSDMPGPMVLSKKCDSGVNADIIDDCGAPENHQSSDVANNSESNLAANIHEKHHNPRLSTFITGDSERSEAVGENNIEDTGFLHIKKMSCTAASSMSQQCSKTEISVFDPTRPENIWREGITVASDNKSYRKHGEIQEADSFNSGIGSCCSRKLDTGIGSVAKSPFVAFSLPRFGDQSTEPPKKKLGRIEVGKRVIQAVTELGISARNPTPLISICRSRTMAFSSGLAKHLVFEIGNDND